MNTAKIKLHIVQDCSCRELHSVQCDGMNSELLDFAKMLEKHIVALRAERDASSFHGEKKAEIAKRYSVNESLFRGESFWKECARKAACRELRSA